MLREPFIPLRHMQASDTSRAERAHVHLTATAIFDSLVHKQKVKFSSWLESSGTEVSQQALWSCKMFVNTGLVWGFDGVFFLSHRIHRSGTVNKQHKG